ncbi:MAG: hypothetical protein NXI32_09690 [bacterium]|nr:hypothetical protein [bacterium]
MLDRESTFAHPAIAELLKTEFVPVAIDQANQRRQKDTEGVFYRKIAAQSPRNDFEQTTQGFYVADANGRLFFYNNNRDPEKLLRLMRKSLSDFDSNSSAQAAPLTAESVDSRFQQQPPEGGLVLRVHTKVLDGYPPTDDPWRKIFQQAIGRDNLWISDQEHEQLRQGRLAESLLQRIARFHLVDNTRGEPPMWKQDEIRQLECELVDGRLRGKVQLQTADGQRGYEAQLLGELWVRDGSVVRFDLVCLGEFWGQGRFTGGAPEGRFPLAVTFTLADGSDMADAVPPQGARGWLAGYCQQCAQ